MSLHPWNYYSTHPRRKIGAVLALLDRSPPSPPSWPARSRVPPTNNNVRPHSVVFSAFSPKPFTHSSPLLLHVLFHHRQWSVSVCHRSQPHRNTGRPLGGFFWHYRVFFRIWSRQCWPYPVGRQWTGFFCVVCWKSATHGCTWLEEEPCKSE